MVTKFVLTFFAIAISGSLAQSCQNPKVEATSFTTNDATVVTQIAYITHFSLKCDNPLPENYALYAEVEGKSLTAVHVGENKYQVSWTAEPSRILVSVYDVNIFDEEGWASLRRARRSEPSVEVAPLLSIKVVDPGYYSGPWVNTEILASFLCLVIAYTALRHKSKILA